MEGSNIAGRLRVITRSEAKPDPGRAGRRI